MNYYWQHEKNTWPRNAFENNFSTDIKLSRHQISEIIQSLGFLGELLSKTAVPLIKLEFHWQKIF